MVKNLKKKAKKSIGRPEHIPTDQNRKQVKTLVGYGLRQEDIAKLIGITFKTLQKHYLEEIQTGKATANAEVVNCLFQSIKKGNVIAQIFWLKTQCKWKDTEVIQSDDNKLPTPNLIDITEAKK